MAAHGTPHTCGARPSKADVTDPPQDPSRTHTPALPSRLSSRPSTRSPLQEMAPTNDILRTTVVRVRADVAAKSRVVDSTRKEDHSDGVSNSPLSITSDLMGALPSMMSTDGSMPTPSPPCSPPELDSRLCSPRSGGRGGNKLMNHRLLISLCSTSDERQRACLPAPPSALNPGAMHVRRR